MNYKNVDKKIKKYTKKVKLFNIHMRINANCKIIQKIYNNVIEYVFKKSSAYNCIISACSAAIMHNIK